MRTGGCKGDSAGPDCRPTDPATGAPTDSTGRPTASAPNSTGRPAGSAAASGLCVGQPHWTGHFGGLGGRGPGCVGSRGRRRGGQCCLADCPGELVRRGNRRSVLCPFLPPIQDTPSEARFSEPQTRNPVSRSSHLESSPALRPETGFPVLQSKIQLPVPATRDPVSQFSDQGSVTRSSGQITVSRSFGQRPSSGHSVRSPVSQSSG